MMDLLKTINPKPAIIALILYLCITAVYKFGFYSSKPPTYPVYGFRQGNPKKLALIWNRPPHIPTQPFAGCPHMCLAHENRIDYQNNDAVIFSTPDLSKHDFPKKPRGQVWIFQGHEPPSIYPNPSIFKKWRNLFNWTMNYRRDSDILFLYYDMRPKKPEVNDNLYDMWLHKVSNISIAVSNCHTQGKRSEYLRKMRKYIKVDMYGKCGEKTCRSWGTCLIKFNRDYKFHLAFENSLCIDYVTEKLYKVYQYNSMIPVVRGGASYKIFVPPKSYISTSDFDNIQLLTQAISNISNDYNSYKGFIDARKSYGVYEKQWWCEICKRLHNQDKYKRLYDDIYGWNFGNMKLKICKNPEDVI